MHEKDKESPEIFKGYGPKNEDGSKIGARNRCAFFSVQSAAKGSIDKSHSILYVLVILNSNCSF